MFKIIKIKKKFQPRFNPFLITLIYNKLLEKVIKMIISVYTS